MKLVIGSDHGGYALKQEIIQHLQAKGYEIMDIGCESEASCDYPDYAKKACAAIRSGEAELGILVCGTGIGMSMA
ncbi:MAG: RpiB/LacA/LacB family sugar-phosphate isomerase, partial [Eubacterium sp.]|nr:RpiB/LacA/LacB family sugar-phosphate isomerase [Eubacterium sp.]